MCKLVQMSMGSSFHHLGARTANSRDFDECLVAVREQQANLQKQSGVNGLGCNV